MEKAPLISAIAARLVVEIRKTLEFALKQTAGSRRTMRKYRLLQLGGLSSLIKRYYDHHKEFGALGMFSINPNS
jgi:hypothetical protein